jgi:uncharacterized protein YbjT (DUF2867 family)
MSEKKTIAVIGATGAQGGGLARAILAEPNGAYGLRALTRNPSSQKAQDLATASAEVIAADLTDQQSVRSAFRGAYGAYVVTNFWESMSPQAELQQARVAARAAADARLRHVIWSTLEDTRHHLPISDPRLPTLQESYTVPHFDAKAEANAFFAEFGVPTTYLQTTFYWEAFLLGFGPKRDDDGKLVLTLPMGGSKLAGIASEDIGKTALGIFKRGEEFIGRTVSIAGEHLTGAELAQAFSEVIGEPVTYRAVSHDDFRALGMPAGDEIGNMFQYYTEAADDFTGARDLDLVRRLNPELQDFRTWLRAHKDAFAQA